MNSTVIQCQKGITSSQVTHLFSWALCVFGNCMVLLQGFVFLRSLVDQTQVGGYAPTMLWAI